MENQKNVKVKIEQMKEKLYETNEDLLDAQELTGNLVLSENQKMTEIDRLKARIHELENLWVQTLRARKID